MGKGVEREDGSSDLEGGRLNRLSSQHNHWADLESGFQVQSVHVSSGYLPTIKIHLCLEPHCVCTCLKSHDSHMT